MFVDFTSRDLRKLGKLSFLKLHQALRGALSIHMKFIAMFVPQSKERELEILACEASSSRKYRASFMIFHKISFDIR